MYSLVFIRMEIYVNELNSIEFDDGWLQIQREDHRIAKNYFHPYNNNHSYKLEGCNLQ